MLLSYFETIILRTPITITMNRQVIIHPSKADDKSDKVACQASRWVYALWECNQVNYFKENYQLNWVSGNHNWDWIR